MVLRDVSVLIIPKTICGFEWDMLLLLLLKKVGSAMLRESDIQYTPYQSEDPRPTIPTYSIDRKKRNGKKVQDYSMDRVAKVNKEAL